jgi:hypothetical protein
VARLHQTLLYGGSGVVRSAKPLRKKRYGTPRNRSRVVDAESTAATTTAL